MHSCSPNLIDGTVGITQAWIHCSARAVGSPTVIGSATAGKQVMWTATTESTCCCLPRRSIVIGELSIIRNGLKMYIIIIIIIER
jgi:hypothetical protein